MTEDRIHDLLNFWFGDLGHADLPSSERTSLWFGESPALRQEMIKLFQEEYEAARLGNLHHWLETPRGRLAIIILLDQFSRGLYHNSEKAFSCDKLAQKICLEGINQKVDKDLTLIERVFFYMPLVHAEDTSFQEKSLQLFQNLVNMSLPETTQVYQLFLAYAYAHFRVIKEFGRFPQRNIILGRESTSDEIAFLKSS